MTKSGRLLEGTAGFENCDFDIRICLLLGACLLVLLALGCDNGPATGEVKGKVTFKGKPVTEGTVTFLNLTEGGAAEASIETDGSYTASQVVVGQYVVEIKPLTEIVDTDPGKSPPAPVEKKAPDIPRKYRQQGSTPFQDVKVEKGLNEINFEMM